MASSPRRTWNPQHPRKEHVEEMITYTNPKLPWPRNQGRGRIEELRAWVGNERERARGKSGLSVVRMSELLREKSGLNDVGLKPTKQVQPVRTVAPTGQTDPTELGQEI